MQIAMVAAGFTAGEADQLRRAMAAWKRKGGLEQFEDKLKLGMAARGYSEEFATGIIGQIRGFAEYGFPESHAASFALLAYASSWMKCHEPAAFLAALLNSQPMGFYSPSQLVQDAVRHGVEVRGLDINISQWEASLEPSSGTQPAVRLGLNIIRGMQREAAWRIEEARAVRPFSGLHDLGVRADIDAEQLKLLASANALAGISGNRRQAMWNAAGSTPDKDLLRQAHILEEELILEAPSEGQELVADYRHIGLTLGRHPLTLLRERLHAMRFMTAEVLNLYDDARLARGCGVVTVRQRPETAKGVVFLTIEDETGNVNVIVWPSLLEQQRREVMSARLLGVYGQWQCANNVRHLVAKRLVDLSHLLGELDTRSRNFH
jgi:error-prone DNA polymerase